MLVFSIFRCRLRENGVQVIGKQVHETVLLEHDVALRAREEYDTYNFLLCVHIDLPAFLAGLSQNSANIMENCPSSHKQVPVSSDLGMESLEEGHDLMAATNKSCAQSCFPLLIAGVDLVSESTRRKATVFVPIKGWCAARALYSGQTLRTGQALPILVVIVPLCSLSGTVWVKMSAKAVLIANSMGAEQTPRTGVEAYLWSHLIIGFRRRSCGSSHVNYIIYMGM